jgi:hypothetical protein
VKREERKRESVRRRLAHTKQGKTRLEFDDATTLGHWLKYMAISNVKMEQVREQEEIKRGRRLEMDK